MHNTTSMKNLGVLCAITYQELVERTTASAPLVAGNSLFKLGVLLLQSVLLQIAHNGVVVHVAARPQLMQFLSALLRLRLWAHLQVSNATNGLTCRSHNQQLL